MFNLVVLDETLYICVPAPNKAGGNWYQIYTTPPDLKQTKRTYLQHTQVPVKVPSRHKHSKMDLCQKKMALHLHLHLHWLCACMNQKAVAIGTLASANPPTFHLQAYCTGVYCHHHPLQ